MRDMLAPKMLSNAFVLEVNEDWGNQLWEVVNKTYGEIRNEVKPPIEEIDFAQKTLELEMRLDYGGCRSKTSHERKAESFKTLPSYLGEYEAKSKVKKLWTLKMPSSKTLDFSSLSMLLSTPIKCTLPLVDLLRARIDLWEEIACYLHTAGVDIPMGKLNHMGEKENMKKI